uniref:Tryptophyllin-T3-2 n=2 Tax=Pithecopus TaxID=1911155 RepID=TY32_PITAZ|nr:RecName: Full=Tryptophyllin-T3-2; Short=Pha-T3-2; AltName: Full=Tryptophyllin-10 [Pithecopus azureus]
QDKPFWPPPIYPM